MQTLFIKNQMKAGNLVINVMPKYEQDQPTGESIIQVATTGDISDETKQELTHICTETESFKTDPFEIASGIAYFYRKIVIAQDEGRLKEVSLQQINLCEIDSAETTEGVLGSLREAFKGFGYELSMSNLPGIHPEKN